MIRIRPQSAIVQSYTAFLHKAKHQIKPIDGKLSPTYYKAHSFVSLFFSGLEFMKI
jgi:hypothetical protein